MEKSPEQVVRALRCTASVCVTGELCEECPYNRFVSYGHGIYMNCDVDQIALDAADLIESLTAQK